LPAEIKLTGPIADPGLTLEIRAAFVRHARRLLIPALRRRTRQDTGRLRASYRVGLLGGQLAVTAYWTVHVQDNKQQLLKVGREALEKAMKLAIAEVLR